MIIAAYAGKGRADVLTDPLCPENYMINILRAEREYCYVLIPTDMEVICRLREEYGRKVVLCYPAGELKEENRERFAARPGGDDRGAWNGSFRAGGMI